MAFWCFDVFQLYCISFVHSVEGLCCDVDLSLVRCVCGMLESSDRDFIYIPIYGHSNLRSTSYLP